MRILQTALLESGKPYTGSIEKHVGYAIQWFLMALVLAIIGIRLAIKQRKK